MMTLAKPGNILSCKIQKQFKVKYLLYHVCVCVCVCVRTLTRMQLMTLTHREFMRVPIASFFPNFGKLFIPVYSIVFKE